MASGLEGTARGLGTHTVPAQPPWGREGAGSSLRDELTRPCTDMVSTKSQMLQGGQRSPSNCQSPLEMEKQSHGGLMPIRLATAG